MTPPAAALRERLRSRKVQLTLAFVLILALAVIYALVAHNTKAVETRTQFVTGTPEGTTPVRLDTTLYLPPATPAPGILLSQGFGGDKTDLDGEARELAEKGYVVLAYSARGFGRSGGLIHFAAPSYEVHDGSLLLDYLSRLPEVRHVRGRALLATAGSSYGGALALLIAAADRRVGAVAADITWNDLSHALFPNDGGSGPGPFKRQWAGNLFASALPPGPSDGCGRYAPDVCAAYQASAAAGAPTPPFQRMLRQASPASVLSKISAPTLLTQGESDSLFPLSEADANARGLAAHGTPVRVVWRDGGHDDPEVGMGTATADTAAWFDTVFDGHLEHAQPFRFVEQAGVVSAATGNASQRTLQAAGYPGIAGAPARSTSVHLAGPAQPIIAPAGGTPAVITQIPGISNVLPSSVTLPPPAAPGQTATFSSPLLADSLLIAGQPTVRLTVTTQSTSDAVLFAGLRDVGPDGSNTLPAGLVAPLRLTGLTPGVPQTVTVRLPAIVRNMVAGHRLLLSVSTTDFAYAVPLDARSYTVALGSATLTVPTISGTEINGGDPVIWVIVGGIVCLLLLSAVAIVLVRRRLVLRPVRELADLPVHIAGLVKEYSGGYRAVDDISFRVERGQVVGLLGPNGAGKTTVLRVLVGLITPTSGAVHVFGAPVHPGASVLARVGAFIEGPGFLPHLTGRENLRLYWAATGRPADEADFATALDIAGLGTSIDRRVNTYSHGMKQRLGIAQAMLGLPELLVLDEPTNGLDPPQIAEMREVLQRYAQTGRTVLVSSHLLAEVEQTCTHVVVMHRGRVVAVGPTAEIAGAGGMQLAVPDPLAASQVLADAGIVADLVPARRALEDVFLDLVGGDGHA